MNEQHTDFFLANGIDENSNTKNGEKEKNIHRSDKNKNENDHEIDTHDGLTTIPEETESLASKLDDFEQNIFERDIHNHYHTEEEENKRRQDEREDVIEYERDEGAREDERVDEGEDERVDEGEDEKVDEGEDERVDEGEDERVDEGEDEREEERDEREEEEGEDEREEKEGGDVREEEREGEREEEGEDVREERDGEREEEWPVADVTEAAEIKDIAVPATEKPTVSISENIVSMSEEDSSIDRATNVELYKNQILELTIAKQRNILLQKKVMEHLKKRKMDGTSKIEDVAGLDLELKYLQQLQEFTQLKDELSKAEQQRESELQDLEMEKNNLNKIVEAAVDELVAYLSHTADKLQRTFPKTLKNEMVELLTGRLVSKLEELSKLQLGHIKLRNRVAVQQERKRVLEGCGEVLQLASYEQLRTENKYLVGRVEVRDEELQRLRERTMTTVHSLAHVRQKAWVTDRAVEDKSGQLRAVEEQLAKLREEISAMKKRREHYRAETQKLRQAAGLLTEPAMLRDFEQSAEEATRMSAELQNIKNSFYDDQSKLTKLRGMLQLVNVPGQSDSMQCVQICLPCQPGVQRK